MRWRTLSGSAESLGPHSWFSAHALSTLRDRLFSPACEKIQRSRKHSNTWGLILSTRDDKDSPRVTLLCIDDDNCWLQYEKIFLESFGYAVETACSGREALELAEFHRFDVAIVDYCMPEMNGQEFAVAMRRRWPRTPIVMLSGMLDVPDEVFQVVDAFVGKECFAKGLLPAITLLKEEHSVTAGIHETGN